MRYKIAIFCENQVKVFNVETTLSVKQMYILALAFVKQGYHVSITDRVKKHKNLLSLEEFLVAVHEFRFYKYITVQHVVHYDELKHLCSIQFPVDIKIVLQWTREDYCPMTFFKLETCDNSSLISIDFEGLQKEFTSRGLDLCKSKTEGIWYTHNYVKLLDVCNELFISKVVKKESITEAKEKVEL